MKNLLLLLFLSASLSAQKIGYLSEVESLPMYGGFVWDFAMGTYKGDNILFVSMSGGHGIYYATFPKGKTPKIFNWKRLFATRLGGPFFFPATSKLAWHSKSETLFFINDLDLYTTKLEEEARFQYFCNDFLLLGDTLISTTSSRGGRQYLRAAVTDEGVIQEINREYGPPNHNYYNSYYRLSADPKTGKIVYWGDTLLHSAQPYYSSKSQLTYHPSPLRIDTAVLKYQDPAFHIDEEGVWHALVAQNYRSWIGPPDTTGPYYETKPRLWFRSYDQGMTWSEPEVLKKDWPIKYAMPPVISSARDKLGTHISAGSLYRSAHKGWQKVGRLYKSVPGMYVYDGTSMFYPGNASVAFHATNYGPAMSTHYGDSLFLVNKGLKQAGHMSDLYYERRAGAIAAASMQEIVLLQEAGTPYETLMSFRPPVKVPNSQQVAYDAENGIIYSAAEKKLYRRFINSEYWELLLDPQEEFGFFMSWSDEIHDIAIDPHDAKHLILFVEKYNLDYVFLETRDGGETWDSLFAPMDYVILEHLKWLPVGDSESRLYFSQRDPNYPYVHQFFYYHFEKDSAGELRTDTIPGFGDDYDILIQFDLLSNTDRVVALTDMGLGFTVAYQKADYTWETVPGESVEHCYGCYSFPSSISSSDDFVFIGVGHWLFMYEFRGDSLRYVGRRPDPMPRYENYRFIQFIGNDMYIGGEGGFYRQTLYEYDDPLEPDSRWNFYPNPSKGLLRIQPPAAVEVFTLTGQRVYSSPHPEYQIDLSNLQEGLYLIKHPLGRAKRFYKLE